jgi:hypothetical protein
MGKVEFHFGELFPRVGFIVTNLSAPSREVVRFYNKRGMAEQWIKEGKQAVAMDAAFLPPLPSQPGAAVAECYRLQPWQPVAATGAAQGDRQLVADQSSAAAGENRRALDKARPLLLAAAGGESPDAAAVWRHAAEDSDAADASRIGCPQSAV